MKDIEIVVFNDKSWVRFTEYQKVKEENEKLKQQNAKMKCCHSCKSHKLNNLKNCQTCNGNYSKWEFSE